MTETTKKNISSERTRNALKTNAGKLAYVLRRTDAITLDDDYKERLERAVTRAMAIYNGLQMGFISRKRIEAGLSIVTNPITYNPDLHSGHISILLTIGTDLDKEEYRRGRFDILLSYRKDKITSLYAVDWNASKEAFDAVDRNYESLQRELAKISKKLFEGGLTRHELLHFEPGDLELMKELCPIKGKKKTILSRVTKDNYKKLVLDPLLRKHR